MRPAVGDLTSGSYTLPTVKGPVRCSFEQPSGPGSLRVSLQLPVGVEASVALPHPQPHPRATAAADGGADGSGPPLALHVHVLVDGAPWSSVRREEAHAVATGLTSGAHVVAYAW